MDEPSPRRDDRLRGLALVGAMLALMWVLEAIDAAGAHLDDDGIRPRTAAGLEGIVFGPFLHASFAHLLSNTIPFAILGAVIALNGLARVALVTLVVGLVSGAGTWLTAASGTDTIGASGLVFGFAAYLIARGLFSRRALHLAAGVVVLAVYGGSLAFSLIPTPGVSWQAHLFGALGGILAARTLDGVQRRRLAPAAGT